MKQILVIGGMGYIGTVFIKNMLKRNYMITCIDNFIYNQLIQKNLFSDIKNFKFIEKDFRNFDFNENEVWECLNKGDAKPADIIAKQIQREIDRDPDCWVVSVQDRMARNIFNNISE